MGYGEDMIMDKYITKIAMVMTALFMAVPVLAIEFNTAEIGFPIETVEVHGFFSQGYMKSSNNNVYSKSHEGTLDLRDFGINFSGYLTEDIRLAAQFMGYSLGDLGKDHINLHYGYVDYNIADELGFRAGRVRVPAGLYNETRDIDMLRTSIFLPQSVYPEVYRDFFASVDAVSIYGNIDLNDLGSLNYSAHVGTLVNDEDPASDLPFLYGSSGLYDIYFDRGCSAGAQLVWYTPVNGLVLGWTWRRIDNIIQAKVDTPGGTINVTPEIDNFGTQIWSVEYTTGKLVLNGELTVLTEHRNGTGPAAMGWYTGAEYELTDKFSVGGNYSTYHNEAGASFLRRADPVQNYEDTFSVYGCYDITDSWLVKAQVDYNKGTGRHRNSYSSATDEIDSVLFSVKTTWSF